MGEEDWENEGVTLAYGHPDVDGLEWEEASRVTEVIVVGDVVTVRLASGEERVFRSVEGDAPGPVCPHCGQVWDG